MQGTGLAVRAQAAVIGDPVGGVGVLLHLGDKDTGANGVQGARLDKEHVRSEHVPFFHRHPIADLFEGVRLDAAAEFLLGETAAEAV